MYEVFGDAIKERVNRYEPKRESLATYTVFSACSLAVKGIVLSGIMDSARSFALSEMLDD